MTQLPESQAPFEGKTVERPNARIPIPSGEFRLHVHADPRDGKEHLALVKGDVAGQEGVLTRVHSECFTGDVLGSLRCDCGWQLTRAMRCIAREGRGVVVYLRQEGRGIGLAEKLRAYNLQDAGHDTVDANLLLGHDADSRDYTGAADILKELGVRSVRLLTNNPHKIEGLERAGLPVAARIPLPPRFTAENTAYLLTKATRMRHLLSLANVAGTGEHDAGRRQPRRRRRAGAAEGERPLVTVSYAQSLDGCISACRGKPLQLSGPEALVMTHELRAAHDGILVGIGTVLADNPRLTVRLVKGKDPQPIVVDTRLRFPLEANLLGRGSPGPWIAAGVDADPGREAALEACGARVLRLPLTPAGEVNLAALLRVLGGLGMRSLLVEGGARIITSFLASGLADRLVVTVAPALVGGLHGIESREWAGQQQLPELTCVRAQKLGKDVVVSGDLVRRL